MKIISLFDRLLRYRDPFRPLLQRRFTNQSEAR
jgi:hypothetical protein